MLQVTCLALQQFQVHKGGCSQAQLTRAPSELYPSCRAPGHSALAACSLDGSTARRLQWAVRLCRLLLLLLLLLLTSA